MLSIENNWLKVGVRSLGAELYSLIDKRDNRQLMWCGDDRIWPGTAPILFPFVGRLKHGCYTYRGKRYALPIHGFARFKRFFLLEHTAASLCLAIKHDPDTLTGYPFKFEFQVRFTLHERRLEVIYQVRNPDEDKLYFSLGSHPAFALPADNMQLSNAWVEFSNEETGHCFRLEDGLLSPVAEPANMRQRRLYLNADSFNNDAIIFRNINSRQVSLYSGETRLLSFDTGGMPHLGLWAKPNAPYICLEPWLNTDELPDAVAEWSEKDGMVCLPAGGVYQTGYAVSL